MALEKVPSLLTAEQSAPRCASCKGEPGYPHGSISVEVHEVNVEARDQSGKLAGSIALSPETKTGKAFVRSVQVAAKYRRQGLAKAMLVKYHEKRPGVVVVHNTFTSKAGRALAESMVRAHPSWNEIYEF